MLKTALMFQDHMILQRDKTVAVWGLAEPGARIQVTMQGQAVTAIADESGVWKALCGPYELSFSETMKIIKDDESLTLRDVQVGEVWLAGGQSNMEFHMRYDADLTSEIADCKNDNIRFFDYPEVSYVGQLDEADYSSYCGFWRKAAPDQLERFSAVGYYFAKELQNKYQVPIGIIGCDWGGTPACAWMSRKAVAMGGGQIYLDEYDAAIKALDLAAYEEAFKNNPASWRVDLLENPVDEIIMLGGTMEEMDAKFRALGFDPSSFDASAFVPPMGPKSECRPAGLYESMLRPIAPYGIRGAIWYQGESDGDAHPELYQTLLPALIQDWRELWREDFPFLFVQLAPMEQWTVCNGTPYVEVRAAQQHTADTIPDTGMAVITDVGMRYDIHPKKKRPVGQRLAWLAECKVYKEDVLCEAPTLSDVSVAEGELTLTFANSGSGLYLTDTLPNGERLSAQRLGGLQVYQNGQELDAESLVAAAEGDHVLLAGEEIRSNVPTLVKLARTGWYQVNLYNSAGIPARPAEFACWDKKKPRSMK